MPVSLIIVIKNIFPEDTGACGCPDFLQALGYRPRNIFYIEMLDICGAALVDECNPVIYSCIQINHAILDIIRVNAVVILEIMV